MYVEIVYETGAVSVAQYETEAEMTAALKAHNDRAVNGEKGGPIGQPAERVRAAYVYDEHPNEWNAEETMTAELASKEIQNLLKNGADKNGVVNVAELSQAVRGLTHPMHDRIEGTFDSRFKMPERKKVDLEKVLA